MSNTLNFKRCHSCGRPGIKIRCYECVNTVYDEATFRRYVAGELPAPSECPYCKRERYLFCTCDDCGLSIITGTANVPHLGLPVKPRNAGTSSHASSRKNRQDPLYATCELCGGTGGTSYPAAIDYYLHQTDIPQRWSGWSPCHVCKGTGSLIIGYFDDNDDYDDYGD